MTASGLDLGWTLPEAWLLIPLEGDLDAGVTAALDERAARDSEAMAAYPELRQLLVDYSADARDGGAALALVRWGIGPVGELVTAYGTVERHVVDGAVEADVASRLSDLQVERPDDHRAPVVERIATELGNGVRRTSVLQLSADAASELRGPSAAPEVAQLAMAVELWLWLDGRPDVLRFDLMTFQVGHAEHIGEELDSIVASLELRSG